MRGKLHGIVQRRKLGNAAPAERAFYQVVREVRIFRQQRAVQVGADDATLHASLGGVAAIVSETQPHFADGRGLWPQKRAAAVILETDQRVWRQALDVGVDHHVADETLLARLGADVDKTDARKALAFCGPVVVAQ
jgi:hypothetical protein